MHATSHGHIVPLPFGPGRIELLLRQRALCSSLAPSACLRILRKNAISCSVAPLGARTILLCSLVPEDADGTLTQSEDRRSANPSYSGKNLRSKVFHSAELSGFVRLALLAEKSTLAVLRRRRPHAVLNWELGTPVSVANETLNRGAATPWKI